jgi:DNA-directed RNA polymerase subunit RPC12/RpoP
MAEGPLKFRCYQCNQLLGVPPKRAGSVIACPRCGTELLVPRPETEPQPEPSLAADLARAPVPAGRSRPRSRGAAADTEPAGSEAGSLSSFTSEHGSAIPEDLVALRPEDIRVEAEFVDLVVTTDEPTSFASESATASEPVGFPAEPISAETFLADVPPVSRLSTQATAEQPSVDAAPGAVLPEISIEPPSILRANRPIGPVREVLIQPAVLLVWSMIVLMSLPMAFIAGLLIGHFLWRVP